MDPEQPLYHRLGGDEAITAVVDEFYERVLADDRLAPMFEEVDMDALRAHQAQFISSVTGGPVDYTGADMHAAHQHLDVTHDQFALVATHLRESLEAFDVADEDVDTVLSVVGDLEAQIVTA
jgi:hemoglobin